MKYSGLYKCQLTESGQYKQTVGTDLSSVLGWDH